jgi:hypothetical protein
MYVANNYLARYSLDKIAAESDPDFHDQDIAAVAGAVR